MSYSLSQKRFMAKKAGEDTVTLTMEEVDRTLEQIKELDLLLAKYMDYIPDEMLAEDFKFKE